MSKETEQAIYAIVAKHQAVGSPAIGPGSTLKDLGIESLDAIEIIFEIEEALDVSLPDRDPNFDTGSVQGLVDAFDAALAKKAAGAATPPG